LNHEIQLILYLRYFEEESVGTVLDYLDPCRPHYDAYSGIANRDHNALLNSLSP
jgi:hypothetical protein